VVLGMQDHVQCYARLVECMYRSCIAIKLKENKRRVFVETRVMGSWEIFKARHILQLVTIGLESSPSSYARLPSILLHTTVIHQRPPSATSRDVATPIQTCHSA
jgi:hypothetical protein